VGKKAVVTVKTSEGDIFEITSEGHAGYDAKGYDIVCAAISVLMQCLWIGMEEVLRVENLRCIREPETPKISLRWDPKTPETGTIARAVARSLEEIAKAYPGYVRYDETEETNRGTRF
jgi:uncharacterized protein YsxB (DUF464 family)